MTDTSKLCEQESVEWILKKIPKFSKQSFLKKINVLVTSIDVNIDFFVIGTSNGNLFIINRSDSTMENIFLKRDTLISNIKLIRTIDIFIGIGFNDGSVYVLTIPFKDVLNYGEINQYVLPIEHKATITSICWSKNSEKLFTGDINGLICCTEINHLTKTVVSYIVYQSSSRINQLAYDHRCLVVSNDTQTFIWNFDQNEQIQIGTKPRHEHGKFGVSIIDKLCKIEEMEIVVVRPNGKVWLSDSNGIVKKSILIKADVAFAQDKLISLLPCVTSQSSRTYFDDIIKGKTKMDLGLVIPINQNEILFWSEDSLVIINIFSGNIVASTLNIGKIKSISICNLINMPNDKSNNKNLSNFSNPNQPLYEIWILRQPICENDNKLVRLSFIPLITSRLQIDPFYFCAQARIASNVQINVGQKITRTDNTKEDVISNNEDIQISDKENWLNKITVKTQHIDVVETFNEFKNKTKEVFKQGQLLLNNEDEIAVEEADELTEDGVMINFENPNLPVENMSINFDPSLEVQPNIIGDHSFVRERKDTRKVELIHLDSCNELFNVPNHNEQPKSPPLKKTFQLINEENSIPFSSKTNNPTLNSSSYENSELYLNFIGRSLSPSNIQDISSDDLIFEEPHFNISNEEEFLSHFDEKKFNDSQESNENKKELDLNFSNISSPKIINSFDKTSSQSTESFEVTNNSHPPDYSFPPDNSYPSDNFHPLDNSYPPDNSHIFNEEINTDTNISQSQNNDLSETLKIRSQISEDSLGQNESLNLSNLDSENNTFPSQQKQQLTNAILINCNKWIIHRGPTLSNNAKLLSMTVNTRMIWLTDNKGVLYVGFRNIETESEDNNKGKLSQSTEKMVWLQDSNLRTDRLSSSPNGFILWREKSGEISVYTGVTKIWTPKVVKEKVLLKQYWEVTMQEIKEVDIDEEMAIIVTKRGKLKVINGISSRTPYKQCKSVNITGHVTLATTFNGIIWCVTELDISNTSKLSQHIFACLAKDESGKFDSAYWRMVPLSKDLIKEDEQNFGGLAGSEIIKSIYLGTNNLAWLLTLDSMCFFCKNVSSENPTGDGIWFQITLQFIYQTTSNFEENIAVLSTGIHNRVEKMFGYTETDVKAKRANLVNINSSIILSVKSVPKRTKGNGFLWITSTERNSPCILFESDKNILGHHWDDCFPIYPNLKNRLPGLPALTIWTNIEFVFRNTLWLLHKSGELFCYSDENDKKKIRTVSVPSVYGRIIKISGCNATFCVLTSHSKVLYRIGITESNPYGTDWREIKRGWNRDETIRNISCSDNGIWLIFDNNVYYNEDVHSLIFDTSCKLPWNRLIFQIKDPNSKKLSDIQNFKSGHKNCIWGITEPYGYIYCSIWKSFSNRFSWTYIPGPFAKSIHVSNENLWMIEQSTGNIFVRCGTDWENQPMGDYWIDIPLITKPVIDIAVSPDNQMFAIDIHERLLKHSWTIIEGNISSLESESSIPQNVKSDDYDWELLS